MSYTKTNWVNGVTPVNADNMNKIEDGIANALAKPEAILSSNELVGVGVNGEQVRVQLGNGLTLSGTTSPYTLSASGGGGGGGTQLYKHTFSIEIGELIMDTYTFNIYTNDSQPYSDISSIFSNTTNIIGCTVFSRVIGGLQNCIIGSDGITLTFSTVSTVDFEPSLHFNSYSGDITDTVTQL